jgi:hypothetical protein
MIKAILVSLVILTGCSCEQEYSVEKTPTINTNKIQAYHKYGQEVDFNYHHDFDYYIDGIHYVGIVGVGIINITNDSLINIYLKKQINNMGNTNEIKY